jgi:hypothetical protein
MSTQPPSASLYGFTQIAFMVKYPGDMGGYIARKRAIGTFGRLENVVLSL